MEKKICIIYISPAAAEVTATVTAAAFSNALGVDAEGNVLGANYYLALVHGKLKNVHY